MIDMTMEEDRMTREDIPPICSLCKRVKQPLPTAHNVHGEGAVLVTYWWCETCDVGQPSRPKS